MFKDFLLKVVNNHYHFFLFLKQYSLGKISNSKKITGSLGLRIDWYALLRHSLVCQIKSFMPYIKLYINCCWLSKLKWITSDSNADWLCNVHPNHTSCNENLKSAKEFGSISLALISSDNQNLKIKFIAFIYFISFFKNRSTECHLYLSVIARYIFVWYPLFV